MPKKLSILFIALTLTLPLAAAADQPVSDTKAVPAVKPQPQTKPQQHKGKCCSGREGKQPTPPEPAPPGK
jgi:hypothetical protein